MFYLFLILSLFSFSVDAAHICYFSLNNEKEFKEMDKFTKKINRYSSEKITVQEFLRPGSNPEVAFAAMVKSGVKCDGLVISGHHTGSFGGKNARGSLSVDFMEKLSCKKEFKTFFNSIKAVWLQGCRTLGVGKIESYDTADFHTDRVGAVLSEDYLEQSFADLNVEFSATLDQDNPLSSRYLRIFPRASVFGWTKTAPGVNARSELSIPFHIANMARLTDDRKRYFDNPVGNLSKESAIKYFEAIQHILDNNFGEVASSCLACQQHRAPVQAWLNHGTPASGRKYNFDNPDLNGYEPLFSSNNQFLNRAKELECILKNTNDPDKLLDVLDQILKSETLIGYSFNSIYELMQRFTKQGNINALVKLQNRLKSSPLLNKILMRKLASKELGIIRKIDYYAFWSQMTGSSNQQIEKKIQDAFIKITLKEAKSYDEQDFQKTLFTAMSKNGLLADGEALNKIINSQQSTDDTLQMALQAISDSPVQIDKSAKLIHDILTSKQTNWYTRRCVVLTLTSSKSPIPQRGEILQELIQSATTTPFLLSYITDSIIYAKYPVPEMSKRYAAIIKTEKVNTNILENIAINISSNNGTNLTNTSKLLHEIITSNKISHDSLDTIKNEIQNSKNPDIIQNRDQLIMAICKKDSHVTNCQSIEALK
jgi:hypothetical protein